MRNLVIAFSILAAGISVNAKMIDCRSLPKPSCAKILSLTECSYSQNGVVLASVDGTNKCVAYAELVFALCEKAGNRPVGVIDIDDSKVNCRSIEEFRRP